jgi:GAF domain-containing protein
MGKPDLPIPRDGGPDRPGRPSASYTGDVHIDVLAETLSGLARSLRRADNVPETLVGIVAAAVLTVPGAQYAGITEVKDRRQLTTPAATADLAREIDRAQYETGQGPCVDAVYEHATLRLSDMAHEQRWPDFCPRALRLGVRSMLSFQLYVDGSNLGALNLYSNRAEAFTDESEYVGLLFASHAAVALVGARREHDMNRAVVMRDLIGQAKGILMERHRLTADQAFGLLARASQHTNTKLTEIARNLTETGELYDPRTRP